MEDFQSRVVAEHTELLVKLGKLSEFFMLDIFPTLSGEDKDLLHLQYSAMKTYTNILEMRIKRFK